MEEGKNLKQPWAIISVYISYTINVTYLLTNISWLFDVKLVLDLQAKTNELTIGLK